MKGIKPGLIARRKRLTLQRLGESSAADRGEPMIQGANVHYELARKGGGVSCGGMAAVHRFVQRIGLDQAINRHLQVFKKHCPYYESDHVLNLAYNVLCGGETLQDIETRRNDIDFLNSIGAERIPDPTTSGDFCRRMQPQHIEALQDALDDVRVNVWKRQKQPFLRQATIDMDSTIVPTSGECKGGMDLSYKNIWGYHPLLMTLAETGEVLRITNRGGNSQSGHNAFRDVDKAIAVCRRAGFQKIFLRGDTAFTQTDHLDRWDQEGVTFVFGIAAHKNLVEMAENVPENDWQGMPRKTPDPSTSPRARPANVKLAVIQRRGYTNHRLHRESYVEVPYKPYKCKKTYRLVILRKEVNVTEQGRLFQEFKYFFYLSNEARSALPDQQIICQSNKRCNQENLIAQLNAARALHAPVDDLTSNWAYMVMAALGWTIKAWIALSIPESPTNQPRDQEAQQRILRMEHRTFVDQLIRLPAQIIHTGRKLIVRLLSVNDSTEIFARFLKFALE